MPVAALLLFGGSGVPNSHFPTVSPTPPFPFSRLLLLSALPQSDCPCPCAFLPWVSPVTTASSCHASPSPPSPPYALPSRGTALLFRVRDVLFIYWCLISCQVGFCLPPVRAAGPGLRGAGWAGRRWAAARPSVPDSEVAARLDFCGGAGRGRGVKARRGGDVWDAQPWDGNAAQTDRQTHTHRRAHTPNPKARTTPKRTHFASMTQRN